MRNLKGLFLVVVIVFTGTFVQAQSTWVFKDEDNSEDAYVPYDDIVSELNQARTSTRSHNYSSDPFANVVIHSGVGYVGSFMTLTPSDVAGVDFQTVLQGVQFHLGIDLFSKVWAADVNIRSFGNTELSTNTHAGRETATASLKEFDLKLKYRPHVTQSFAVNVGIGLAARYLNFAYNLDGQRVSRKYTTPASVLFFGADAYFTKNISLGAEISLRSAMVEETIEESSVDATFLMGAHF